MVMTPVRMRSSPKRHRSVSVPARSHQPRDADDFAAADLKIDVPRHATTRDVLQSQDWRAWLMRNLREELVDIASHHQRHDPLVRGPVERSFSGILAIAQHGVASGNSPHFLEEVADVDDAVP